MEPPMNIDGIISRTFAKGMFRVIGLKTNNFLKGHETQFFDSFIDEGVETNFVEYKLEMKAIIKYWYSIYNLLIFYSQDMDSYMS